LRGEPSSLVIPRRFAPPVILISLRERRIPFGLVICSLKGDLLNTPGEPKAPAGLPVCRQAGPPVGGQAGHPGSGLIR